ncbi:MAG: SPOR domain-containing protein [Alphaproteobacteria bacterium]
MSGYWRTSTALVGALAAAFATAACSDEQRPFKRAAQTSVKSAKLIQPRQITPPVKVMPVKGAPAEWKLHERLAKALRARDIPAGTGARGQLSYSLTGRAQAPEAGRAAGHLTIYWQLHDAKGEPVGDVMQLAAVPGAVWKVPNDGVLDQVAAAAAESISPIVPSSALQEAQFESTGEPVADRGRRGGRAATAIARQEQRRGRGKLSRRLLGLANVRQVPLSHGRARSAAAIAAAKTQQAQVPTTPAKTAPGKTAMVKPPKSNTAAPNTATAKAAKPALAAKRPAPQVAARPAKPRPGLRTDRATNAPAATRPAKRPALAARTRVPALTARAKRKITAMRGHWVQVGSFRSVQRGERTWRRLRGAHPTLLTQVPHQVTRADLGPKKGVYYRVQAGPYGSRARAKRLCADLQARRVSCFLIATLPATASVKATTSRPAPRVARKKLKTSAKATPSNRVPRSTRGKPAAAVPPPFRPSLGLPGVTD